MQTRVLAETMAVVQAVVHPMVAARVDIPADMLPLLLAWLSMLILELDIVKRVSVLLKDIGATDL